MPRRAAQTRRALLEAMNPYNTSVSGSSSQTEGLWSVIGQPSPGPRPPHPWGPSAASLAREAADADRTAVVLKGTIYLRPGPRPTTSPCHRCVRPPASNRPCTTDPAVPATRPPPLPPGRQAVPTDRAPPTRLFQPPVRPPTNYCPGHRPNAAPPFGLTTSPMVSPLHPIPASPDLAR